MLGTTGGEKMLKGTCIKCNKNYYGWALEQGQEHQCECGGLLEVSEDSLVSALKDNVREKEELINRLLMKIKILREGVK